jgi:hypothetical protein
MQKISVMYNQAMLFFQCNMFSVCSVHPLIWRVLSTRRTKCTITNCLKSPVVHDNIKHMTHRMRERNPNGQVKIKRRTHAKNTPTNQRWA